MVQSTNSQTTQIDEPQTARSARTVAFQGERGAFGDEAVQVYFGAVDNQQPEAVPYRTFAEVFRAVASGEVNNGLVPVENSQAGSINDTYDLLRQHDRVKVMIFSSI